MLTELPIFPCNSTDKSPLLRGGFKSARRGATPIHWPLVGFATGEASGIEVLDVDPAGRDWYERNFDALPRTRAHQTPTRASFALPPCGGAALFNWPRQRWRRCPRRWRLRDLVAAGRIGG